MSADRPAMRELPAVADRYSILPQFPVKKGPRVLAGIRRDNVPVTGELVFINQQPLNADRAACVRLVRADADFSAESVSKAVCKTSGSVPKDSGRIHFVQKSPRIRFISRHDAVGVSGSVRMNMIDGFVETVNGLHIHDQV